MISKWISQRWLRLAAGFLALALVAAACSDSDSDGESEGSEDQTEVTVDLAQNTGGRLATVIERGELNCGVNDTVPGFGFVDSDGVNVGFDVDFCRVVAAAVLGDADAVNYTALDSGQRFPALQSGEIDLLVRNTTWTATRDGNEQANFIYTTFYDGQGFMVRDDSAIQSLEDMQNATICVLQATTTLPPVSQLSNTNGPVPTGALTKAAASSWAASTLNTRPAGPASAAGQPPFGSLSS